jgi:hypothetical protein
VTGEMYYLSSLDSARFEPVRECRVERPLAFGSGKVAVEARLWPAVIGEDFNRASDIDTVVLSARHEGASLDPVSEFPCFVYITIPRSEHMTLESPIHSDDLKIIGWGELYRTPEDAERHSFG